MKQISSPGHRRIYRICGHCRRHFLLLLDLWSEIFFADPYSASEVDAFWMILTENSEIMPSLVTIPSRSRNFILAIFVLLCSCSAYNDLIINLARLGGSYLFKGA